MKKKIIYMSLGFFISGICLLSGCATIFSDRNTNIPISTNPGSATVTLYTDSGLKIFEGKTPCSIVLNKKEVKNAKLSISLQGYKDIKIDMGSESENSMFANCLLVGLSPVGFLVDIISGNHLRPAIHNVEVILEPAKPVANLNEGISSTRMISLQIEDTGSNYTLTIVE